MTNTLYKLVDATGIEEGYDTIEQVATRSSELVTWREDAIAKLLEDAPEGTPGLEDELALIREATWHKLYKWDADKAVWIEVSVDAR